jgi:hypothetical protein
MRAEAFVLPDPFAGHAYSFVERAATGSDRRNPRMASLRTAPTHRSAFAEYQAHDARTLFAKRIAHEAVNTPSPS